MTPLHIVMLVCPINAATPLECAVGLENPMTAYSSMKKCEARAQEIHEKTAHELYQIRAALRVGCADKQVVERFMRYERTQRKAA